MKISISFLVVIQLLTVACYAQNASVMQYPSGTTQNLTVTTADLSISNASPPVSLLPTSLYVSSQLPPRVIVGVSRASVRRTYINFDVNALGIPPNAVISSAKLYLFNPSTTSTAEAVLPATFFKLGFLNKPTADSPAPSWTEASTWLNQPDLASISESVLTSTFVPTGAVPSHREFDVKAYLQKVVSKAIGDFSCVIQVLNEATPTVVTTAGTYYSRESTIAGTQPKLVISYYIPFSVTNAVIKHASTATSTDGSISPTITGGPGFSAPTYKWYNSAGTVLQTSLSSVLNNVGPGWYGLEITAATGAAGGAVVPPVYMAFLVGAYCETSTIVFAPGVKYIDDATVNQEKPNLIGNGATYSFSTSLTSKIIAPATTPVTYAMNSAMRFYLWVDNQITINSANLVLSGYGTPGNTINTPPPTNRSSFSKLKGDWNENTASWNNISPIPVDPAPPTAVIPYALAVSESKTVDIKSFWDEWKVDNTKNYGFLFKIDPGAGTYPSTYNVSRVFYSSELPVNEPRPVISFTIRLTNNNCKDKVSYAKLEKTLKGVNYRLQNRLLFYYDEEYTNTTHTTINYKIYDESNQIMPVASKPLSHGDNRYMIDISGLSLNKSYILEVTNDKSEKFYLRFTKEN